RARRASLVAGVGRGHVVGVAMARGVRRVARRELPRREVGVGRRDALLQLLDAEAPLLLLDRLHREPPFWKRDRTGHQGHWAALPAAGPSPAWVGLVRSDAPRPDRRTAGCLPSSAERDGAPRGTRGTRGNRTAMEQQVDARVGGLRLDEIEVGCVSRMATLPPRPTERVSGPSISSRGIITDFSQCRGG